MPPPVLDRRRFLGNHTVSHRSEAFHADFDHVSRSQPDGRLASTADAARRVQSRLHHRSEES